MHARTGLVPDWLERQHQVTRPDRVLVVTEYDERITAALGVLPGTLYLVCRRLLLETCGQPADGIQDSLVVSTRELADRVGLQSHAQVVRILGQQTWYLQRAAAAQVVRQANGEVIGRTPTRWQVFGLPPLLPVDQAALHAFIQSRSRPGHADDALAAVEALNALVAQGWGALRARLFAAPATLDVRPGAEASRPQSLLAIAQAAARLSPDRTPMALVQATQTLRAGLRGARTEIPYYLIDHWLPALGPTKFWLLLQVLRECQTNGQADVSLSLADSAERIGLSERTLRRLAQDLGDLLDAYGAFAGAIGRSGNRLEFKRVLYAPETTPLAPVHEQDLVSPGGQISPSVGETTGQNAPSASGLRGQNAPSAARQAGQSAPSAGPALDNAHHRSANGKSSESMRANGQAAPALDKTHLEEKSLNHDSLLEDSLSWGVFWNGMQAHSKLRRNRQIREQAARLPALWVAAVLEQMTRGMEDPITLAVDSFNPETSPQTVPYICLELANRGPAFTARVLAALSWPTLNWPADPDAARCIAELKRIGVRSFREASSVYTLATLNLLGLTQLADRACAQAGPGDVEREVELAEDQDDLPDADIPSSERQRLWARVLEQLGMELPRATFDTWLRSTRLIAQEEGQFIVAAPTQFAADWLAHRMQGAIRRTLSRISGLEDCTVEFQVMVEAAL